MSGGAPSSILPAVGLQWRLTRAIFLGVAAGSAAVVGVFEALSPRLDGPAVAVDALLFPGALRAVVAIGLAAAAGGLLAGPLGFFAARGVKRRLRELGRLAGAVARGELDRRARTQPFDEIGELGDALNRMAARLNELTAEGQRLAALEERQRIARELHDSVAQQLFSLGALAAAARRRLEALAAAGDEPTPRDGLLARAGADVAEIDALARSAHAEMRALIQQLRPPLLGEGSLADALRRLAAEEAARARVAVGVHSTGPARPTAADADLLRVAQEAITNAIRHARPGRIDVKLRYGPGDLTLEVRDDGAGFDPDAPVRGGAAGLRGMRERVAALGGDFAVESGPGEGTRLSVRVPITRA